MSDKVSPKATDRNTQRYMSQHPEITRAAIQLRDSSDSIILSTVDENSGPSASYAPYILFSDGSFGILVSRLAKHTQNLLNTPTASILFIEPESATSNIFARKRLTFQCSSVEHLPRDSTQFNELIELLGNKFGSIAKQLAELPDFEGFRLPATSASYVQGFGSAWQFANGKLDEAHLIRPDR